MAKEDILTIYKLRSEFAHGDIIFPLYYDQHDTSWRASNYFKPAKSASALLLLSIRELVRQDRQDLYIENSENYSSGELLEIANNLLQGILTANSYWQILQQYKKNVDSYAAEMHCSPAFYNTIYLSLVESMYISLSKLYDWDDRSLTLRVLLNNTKYITEETLDEDVLKKYTFCGNKFQRSLSAYEEPFFNKEVADTKKILSLFGHQYHYTTVELSLEETFSLYKNWFKSMQDRKLIKNLMEQRSKIHAHNDKLTNFDYNAVWDEYPLTEDNIEELLAFSIDFIQFFIGILTGIQKAVEYTNIDDWGATLTLVREGQDHLNKQLNEF